MKGTFNMADPTTTIGELYMQLRQESESHRQTIGVLGAVKRGEKLPDGRTLTLDLIVVDERAGSWQIVPPEPSDEDEDEDEHLDKADAPKELEPVATLVPGSVRDAKTGEQIPGAPGNVGAEDETEKSDVNDGDD